MRLVSIPVGVDIQEISLQLTDPNQIVLASRSSEIRTYSYSFPTWGGQVTFRDIQTPIDKRSYGGTRDRMRVFLGELNGQANYTILPHGRNFPEAAEIQIFSSNIPSDPNEAPSYDIYLLNRQLPEDEFPIPARSFGIWGNDTIIWLKTLSGITAVETTQTPVSYTHLTLPTIYSV